MADHQGAVVVLASFMMDLIAHVPRRPRAGESVIGHDFGMYVGGKGNTQAIAAARLGAPVRVIGRLGDDLFAAPFRDTLKREGVDASWVTTDAVEGTGLAMPLIEPGGQNSIVAIPRANMRVSAADVAAAAAAFEGAGVVTAQFEVPLDAVRSAFERARAAGQWTLLNPAPAPQGSQAELRALLPLVDLLVPNEHEAESLTGIPVDSPPSAERAGRALLDTGCGAVVITCGDAGAVWVAGQGVEAVHLPPFAVAQVDATGAGDAFCGALAAGIATGRSLADALRRACATGALAVTRVGAEPALPTERAVEALLRAQPTP